MTRECKEGFTESTSGDKVKVSIWLIIGGLFSISGALLGLLHTEVKAQRNQIEIHGNQITRLEVIIPEVRDNLSQIREEIKMIRKDRR